jgi:hypothetical protein
MALPAPRRLVPAILAIATWLVLVFGPVAQGTVPDDQLARVVARASDQLGALQKQLAVGSDITKRFRLDGFAAVGGRLKVAGVFLEPGFVPPPRTPDPKQPRPPFELLQDEVRTRVREAVKDVIAGQQLLFDFTGIVRLEGKDHPSVLLQKAANDAGIAAADQLRLDTSHFDGDGTLVLVGIRGNSEATRDWLSAAAKTVLAQHPAAIKDTKLAVSFTAVKPVDWKLTPAVVQKLLAASGRPGLDRLRVDRVFLEHNPANPDPVDRWTILRLTLTGIRIGEEKIDAEYIGTLCRNHWADLFAGPTRIQMNANPLLGPGIEEPIAQLRKVIAARPALDGVRVDPGARFGPGGELLLAGLRPKVPSTQQAQAIETGVAECWAAVLADRIAVGGAAAGRYQKLQAGPGVRLTHMTEVDTPKLLRELRAWVRTTRDDVRLSRLYFGPDGGLKLQCEAPTDQDFEAVQGQLRGMTPESAVPVPKAEKLPLPVVEATTIPALTPYFRQQLAHDAQKRWATVLLERGYFDDSGRYNLLGVADSKDQIQALTDFLQSFAADPKWKAYFTPSRPPGELLSLEVIPLAELVARVQRVLPADPKFDGVQIVAASYDAEANLVFSARVVGQPPLDDARQLLAKLIAQHPRYSRRLAKSAKPGQTRLKLVVLPPEPPPPANERPELSVGFAAAALAAGDLVKAKRWIDTGLLHLPQESAIWFLSAYYHLLQGDSELVRRDLLRMIDLESDLNLNGSVARKRRYLATANLQGEKRDELEKLGQKYSKEAKQTPRTITLDPGK